MSGSQRKIRRAEEPQQEAQQGHDAGDEDVHMRTLDAAERGGRAAAHPRLPIPGLADPLPSAEHLWAALAIPEPDEALGDRVAPPPPQPPAAAEKETNNENKPARKAPRYPMLLPWDEQSWSTGSNPDNDTEELTPPRPPTPMPWEEESVSTDPNMEQNWAFVEDLADLEELEEPAEPTGSLALTPESQPPTPPAAACPMQEDIDTPSVTPCPSPEPGPEPESPLDATAWDESETSSGGGNSSHGCCQSVSIGTRSVVAKATTGLGSYPDQGERPSTSAAVRQWLRYQSETSSSASTPERALALAIGFPSAYPALDEGPSTSAAARAWLQQQRGTGRPVPYVGYHMPSLSPTQEDPMQPLVIMVDPEETGILSRPPTSPPPGWEEAPDHWRVRIDNRHLPHRLIQHVVGQEREGRNSHRSFLYNASGILFRVRFNKRNEVTISLRSPI
ncbi:uncharacterized protein DMAD_01566 [Drosophila madeirensis]|uniref:Uncharacterized protein n=1 Tax=Drosophila madeirensis TaxID=30013 RepID=A0AAU9G1H4_DROMD